MEYPLVYEGMPEIWLPVKGHEGKYEVSCYGVVRSIDGFYYNNNANIKRIKTFIRGKKMTNYLEKNGYLRVTLSNDKGSKKELVHRIVAIAFLSNPNNYLQVNHKKGDKSDNRAWMLEWCNSSMNHRHSFAELGRKGGNFYWEGKIGKDHIRSKKVDQYDLSGKLIGSYDSCRLAAKATGAQTSNITNCLKGRRNTAAGFIWKFKI